MIGDKTECWRCGNIIIQRAIESSNRCGICGSRQGNKYRRELRKFYANITVSETEHIIPWPQTPEADIDHAAAQKLTNAIKAYAKRKGWLITLYFDGAGIHLRRRA